MNDLYMKLYDYKITLQGEGDENYCFNATEFRPFDVSGDFLDSRTNLFDEGKNDKNHDVPYRPITRSKASKINQSFILHVQEWIRSDHPQFHVPHVSSRDKGPFGVLNVNIFSVEADNGEHIQLP